MNDKAKSFLSSIKTKLEEKMVLDKIMMDSENSMLRIGFGRNDGHKTFRLDLWSVGYRINSKTAVKRNVITNAASTSTAEPKIYKNLKIEKVTMDVDNRMIRIAYGKNKGRKFFRIDFWSVGYRVTKNEAKTQ